MERGVHRHAPRAPPVADAAIAHRHAHTRQQHVDDDLLGIHRRKELAGSVFLVKAMRCFRRSAMKSCGVKRGNAGSKVRVLRQDGSPARRRHCGEIAAARRGDAGFFADRLQAWSISATRRLTLARAAQEVRPAAPAPMMIARRSWLAVGSCRECSRAYTAAHETHSAASRRHNFAGAMCGLLGATSSQVASSFPGQIGLAAAAAGGGAVALMFAAVLSFARGRGCESDAPGACLKAGDVGRVRLVT